MLRWYTVATALGLALSHPFLAGPRGAHAHSSAWPSGAQSEHTRVRPADNGSGYEAPPPSTLGGPFSLTDHSGRPVTDQTFRGQWMLIFFGFSACREACPTALQNMALVLDALGKDADKIQPLYVDFDFVAPDLATLAQFVSNFHPRLLGLTGTRKQMFSIVKQFRVRRDFNHKGKGYSQKETGPRINHTTYFYLVGPDGVTRSYFYHNLPPAEMAARIRRQM
jgi:cytochrome oxidase Cu insertion factor (SCO1/SenC/PrrC family)